MDDIDPIMVAKGLGGARLLLFQDSIRIERRGIRAFIFQGTTGNKDIQLSSINDIQFRKVGFRHRYMRFLFVNSVENKGFIVHFRDENGIRFRAKQQLAFAAIKAAIENRNNTSHLSQP